MQHSHSSTAQPEKSYCASLEKIAAEVDLAVAERTEASSAIDPRLIAAVYALPAVGTELGILYVKHLDALVIQVEIFEIVELLQHEVAGIVKNIAARMIADAFEKHFERRAVVQVLAGMNLEATSTPN